MVSKKEDLIFVVSLVILCLLLLMKPCCSQTDTLQQGLRLKEGEELLSQYGKFKFGFFSPYDEDSYGRYLGVWYNRVAESSFRYYEKKVVWVANRNTPISKEASELMVYIDTDSNLKISYTKDRCSHVLKLTSVVDELHSWNSRLRLLETGNLVLGDNIISCAGNDTGNLVLENLVFWQSFDYPTDTLLPGMKIGTSLKTGHNWSLTSTRRNSDNYFAQGSYTLGMEDNYQLVIRWLGEIYWKSGHFENQSFFLFKDQSYNSFMKNQSFNTRTLNFSYNSNENEIYYTYSVDDDATPFPLLQITDFGKLRFAYDNLVWCPSGVCVSQGFPNCRTEADYYSPESGFMSRDGFIFKERQNTSYYDCRDRCFYDCSCVAFASNPINGTYNCEIWTQGAHFSKSKRSDARLINIIEYKKNKWRLWLIISIAGGVFVILFSYCCWVIWRKFKTIVEREKQMRLLVLELQGRVQPTTVSGESTERENDHTNELKIFSFESIASATNKFSIANKLGEGGFGPVYKGILPDGQEIAIKRLSKSSGQGLEEFKNEAILIARLQHTTLVRIIGCCVQRQERILIYEYLPNKSLDFFIFGNQSRKLLNWKARFNIIEGIAQGLLYLHKYSRLRVIHRDLKASNILLDDKMNPKISDFGMARIFGLNQSEANTNRVVGTYGYMSPEYAMNGVVSTKTDVYSFGVLLLEIVSGKKNNSSYSFDRPLNLVGHAWVMWNEGRALELLDETIIDEEYSKNEVMRCIHVGLLCVQDFATDRPNMVEVVPMLANEMMPLPELNQPAYFIGSVVQEQDTPEMEPHSFSTNDVTISVLEAR